MESTNDSFSLETTDKVLVRSTNVTKNNPSLINIRTLIEVQRVQVVLFPSFKGLQRRSRKPKSQELGTLGSTVTNLTGNKAIGFRPNKI